MFLYQRPNGIWYVHYDLDGRHLKKTTKCKSKSDALKFLNIFRPEEPEDQEDIRKNRKESVSLTDYWKKYHLYAESRFTVKSVKGIDGAFRSLIETFGNRQMRSLKVSELTGFILDRHQAVSVFSARHYYIMLASAFQTVVK